MIKYRINVLGEITYVNSSWDEFALVNDAPELSSGQILGRSIWEFISDDTTVFLYHQMVDRARLGNNVQFQLRCDSPSTRRMLDVKIEMHPTGDIEFQSRAIQETAREPQELFSRGRERSDEMLTVCSWCNKIKVAEEDWREVENAMPNLSVFQLGAAPQLSHGMCGECYQRISDAGST